MALKHSLRRYRSCYARLLTLYPRHFYTRFGAGLEQTFSDLLREQAAAGRGLFGCALRMYLETALHIVRDNLTYWGTAMETKAIVRAVLVTACILLVPLAARLLTAEMAWSGGDFALVGGMLLATALGWELNAPRRDSGAWRLAVASALGSWLLLTWSNLAVGDIIYLAVLAIGIAGAVITRFAPQGMARTQLACAGAHVLVTVLALAAGLYRGSATPLSELVGINVIFVGMFLVSAWLFHRVESGAHFHNIAAA
jgi:hypothetical protein